jgi:hypothetical protein
MMIQNDAVSLHSLQINPDESDPFEHEAPESESDGTSVCDRGRRKLVQLTGLGGGALFVLVPNSELIHSAVRAVLGVGGVECC